MSVYVTNRDVRASLCGYETACCAGILTESSFITTLCHNAAGIVRYHGKSKLIIEVKWIKWENQLPPGYCGTLHCLSVCLLVEQHHRLILLLPPGCNTSWFPPHYLSPDIVHTVATLLCPICPLCQTFIASVNHIFIKTIGTPCNSSVIIPNDKKT